jgi:hypothetical protein
MITTTKSSSKDISKYFARSIRSVETKQRQLIELAKIGAPRPSQKTILGRALSDYTKNSTSRYKEFNKIIRELRPDWFFSQTEIANQKKQKLIEMAKNGEGRPSCDRTKLGQALSNYTRKSSEVYDPIFDKLIRELRPDWFV